MAKASFVKKRPKYLDKSSVAPKDIWKAAKKLNPDVRVFVGEKDGIYYFQEFGNQTGVAVDSSK